jgi:hypothetical protein
MDLDEDSTDGSITMTLVRIPIEPDSIAEMSRSRRPRPAPSRLEELYVISDQGALWRFLFEHSQLAQVLVEAYAYLQRHFGPNPQVILETVRDPEVPQYAYLFASVQTNLALNEALARLDIFLDEWFRDQPSHIDRFLTFTADGI